MPPIDWDLTLTLKQGRQSDDGRWFWGDENQYRAAFRHFMKRLNNAVYGNTTRRYRRRLRVIPVLEKDANGRWHFHAAIEPPLHMDFEDFEERIHACWSRLDWGYRITFVRDNADKGWVNYMLKLRQKSEFENWSDCIDWGSLHNPIADA
jgi:hypothetical protein